MPTYEVVEVLSETDKPDKGYGPKKSIKLKLSGDFSGVADVAAPVLEGRVPLIAEWYANADTPTPKPGEKLDGDVSKGKYGYDFKKAGKGGGGRGGGGRPRDPKDDQRIVRQHSQKCAVELLNTAHELGLVAPARDGETPLDRVGELVTMVKTVAEHLEAHVYRGMDTPIPIQSFDVVPRQ